MTRSALAMLLSVALSASAASQPATADSDAETRAGVAALVQRWSDAGTAKDWDAIAQTYADQPGFAWIEQGEARYTDRAAIVAGLDGARKMKADIDNKVSNIVVTPLAPGVAAYRADYRLSVKAEGFGYSSSGVLSGVAVKRDGTWRFLQGAFSERPPAPAKP